MRAGSHNRAGSVRIDAMARRIFTPVQASRTLPLVKRIVADILAKGKELRTYANRKLGQADLDQVDVLQVDIRELVRELASVGCDYKGWDFDRGLVDFPGRIDGRDVLLCWRSDEPELAFYHAPEAGYAGRQPIPAELLASE